MERNFATGVAKIDRKNSQKNAKDVKLISTTENLMTCATYAVHHSVLFAGKVPKRMVTKLAFHANRKFNRILSLLE